MDSETRARLDRIEKKLDGLLEDGHFNEFISFKLIVILVIIGIITAIWSDLLMKKLNIKERQNPALVLLLSAVSVVVILLLLWKIDASD